MKFKKINILSIISVAILIIFGYYLGKIDLLPMKYLILIIFIISILTGIFIGFVNLKKKNLKIMGIVFLSLGIIINLLGTYYAYNTDKFLNKSFSNAKDVYSKLYYVLTYKDNNNEDIKNINYFTGTANIDKALDKLNIENKNSYDDLDLMFNDLKNKKQEFIIVDGIYEVLSEMEGLFKEDYKVVRTLSLDIKNENSPKETKDIFNLYIGGNDFSGQRIDFNMIVTVNLNTNKVLLTSIPRDYYINEYGTGGKNKLSYMSSFDVNKKSIEDFLGINIDYYMHINTSSLVKLVDVVGGINYCSSEEYTTTHALVLNTYDDTKGEKFHVSKGCQHLNGIETLTVARERLNIKDGDNGRQRNCQTIMLAIFNKLKSMNTLTNYSNILDSVSNFYETNMPKKVFSNFTKELLDGKKMEVLRQSATGKDGIDYIYQSSIKDWVMYPNSSSVSSVKTKIEEVTNEK